MKSRGLMTNPARADRNMKIVNSVIGSAEWLASFSASKAPTMMGANSYQSRNDLLRVMASGIPNDVDAATQARYDAGHAAEAGIRPHIENRLGKLLPAVSATDDEGYLTASFDGLAHPTGWECKLWNEKIIAQIKAKELDPFYYWQLEQQILVGGLKRVIFTCTDGTPENCISMEYRSVPGRAERLLAGWKQFAFDLANYRAPEVIPVAVAVPVMALPALSIQVKGEIALIDNLKVFGEGLQKFVEAIPKEPATDQEFADCKHACKVLQEAQDRLDAAEAHALGQIVSFDEMKRTKALYWELARTTRLAVEKLVERREKDIKEKIVLGGKDALAEHIANLNKRLGKLYMPVIQSDFAGAAKGKRTIVSLRNAVDTELAMAKIEASAVADRIQINLDALQELGKDHAFLFADVAQICLKANDDFCALVKLRIAEHKANEEKRLEAEREKIRVEEQRKAQAEAEAARIAQERESRTLREAEAKRSAQAQSEEFARQRAIREAEEVKIRAEEARFREAQRKAEFEARAKRAAEMEAAGIEQAIRLLRTKIEGSKSHAGIAKAIDMYISGRFQKEAA